MPSPPPSCERAFLGTVLHTPVCGELEVLPEALLVVGSDGVIKAIHRRETAEAEREARRFAAGGELVTLGSDQYLLPGMVDLHVHAPQWPQLGKALDLPLEQWLQAYTFPLESRYADAAYARTVYESLVDGPAGEWHDHGFCISGRSICSRRRSWLISACAARSVP